MDCDTLFQKIQTQLKLINVAFIQAINGKTFTNSTLFIETVRHALNVMKLTYVEECINNESVIFTDVNGIGLSIEIKIANSHIINFDDTCPSEQKYYVIFFTGDKKNVIPPQILFLKGDVFLKNDKWILDYVSEFKYLKDKYIYNNDIMRLTHMFNFKADISSFLTF